MKTTVVFKSSERKDLVFNAPKFLGNFCYNYLCEKDTLLTRLLVFILNNKKSPIDCVIFG